MYCRVLLECNSCPVLLFASSLRFQSSLLALCSLRSVYFVGGLDGAAGQSRRVDIFDRGVLEGQ